MTLEALFAGRNYDIEASKQRLKQVAKELGLPLGDRKMTYNSRLAQELAKVGGIAGQGRPFSRSRLSGLLCERDQYRQGR